MADIRSVTIEDVAAAAGVSVATVSRALRGLDNVAHSTREKVELAAAELGYVANPAAAKLAAGSSKTIVVAVSNIAGWFSAQVVGGVEAVLSEAGYDTQVMGVAGPKHDATSSHPRSRCTGGSTGLSWSIFVSNPMRSTRCGTPTSAPSPSATAIPVIVGAPR